SARCAAGLSSTASAAATPPWAQYDAVSASGVALTTVTWAPARAAQWAAQSPAAPAPTLRTSVVATGSSDMTGTVSGVALPLFRHESSLRHDTGSHPERAARLVAIERELEARGWCGFAPEPSPAATLP